MTIYTIYKTTNIINQRYYIGKHKTEDPHDSYLGSGKILRKAIRLYGRDNFVKEVLEIHDTEDAAYIREADLVTQEVVDDPLSYNICLGGLGGKIHTEETLLKISAKMKGNTPWNKGKEMWSDEERTEIGKRNTARGPQSEETIQKRVAKNKGKKRTEETKKLTSNSCKGRIHSNDSRKKMSAAKKGKPWTEARRAAHDAKKDIS